jgi:hypothetical protein
VLGEDRRAKLKRDELELSLRAGFSVVGEEHGVLRKGGDVSKLR